MNIDLKCKCGKVKGLAKNISPEMGNHVICMCDDCQAFAYFLGSPESLLDENGGTEIFQIAPSQVEITAGHEFLKCMQMGPKGLRRWYSDCCKTPIANNMSLKFSVLGIISSFVDLGKIQLSSKEYFGPVIYRCMGKYGKGSLPDNTYQKFPHLLLFKVIKSVIYGRFSKSYLPNPFFNEKTGQAVVQEMVISKEERKILKARLYKGSE